MTAADFPRDLGALPSLLDWAEAFAGESRLAPGQGFLVAFVLEELFTNMVKYNPAGGGRIGVELGLEGPELRIQLRDPDCPSFDIRTDAPAVDPGRSLEDRTPGGLGVHLVKAMVDRIDYDHTDRTGTLRLYKRLE
jgi:anti-sigma regulatory factor (Ser/Thr protein kinase)